MKEELEILRKATTGLKVGNEYWMISKWGEVKKIILTGVKIEDGEVIYLSEGYNGYDSKPLKTAEAVIERELKKQRTIFEEKVRDIVKKEDNKRKKDSINEQIEKLKSDAGISNKLSNILKTNGTIYLPPLTVGGIK